MSPKRTRVVEVKRQMKKVNGIIRIDTSDKDLVQQAYTDHRLTQRLHYAHDLSPEIISPTSKPTGQF